MPKKISIEIKNKCVDMLSNGMSYEQVYKEYFIKEHGSYQNLDSFKRTIRRWKQKNRPSELTLQNGTYNGFIAHDATVQVSAEGEIIQAWIKQTHDCNLPLDFLEALRESVEPYIFEKKDLYDANGMLEIPLFDMHWGISYLDYYKPLLNDILTLITSKMWKKIVIPFGQDFFHNDSVVKGETTKGTVIEKVDTIRAVKESKIFMFAIIEASLDHSDEVRVIYSPGNHDQSISWMFMQVLLERYGDSIIDDQMAFRRVYTYGNNAIMITHGNSKRATPTNLAQIFPVSFPKEFSESKVREIHAGHLHSESDCDVNGIMVRRLSSGNKTDEWSDKEDFVGAHKRFMLFEYSEEKLKSIHYL